MIALRGSSGARLPVAGFLGVVLMVLPPVLEAAPTMRMEGKGASPSTSSLTRLPTTEAPEDVTLASKEKLPVLHLSAAQDSSRAGAAVPFYKRRSVLAGALVLLAGVLVLALGGGSDEGAPRADDGLPGFPPPPSSQP